MLGEKVGKADGATVAAVGTSVRHAAHVRGHIALNWAPYVGFLQ